MSESRYRVLVIASHPVQYAAPIYRLMAQHPRVYFQVAYCSLRGAEAGHDPEFGTTVKWDIPLLDGYAWTHVPNRGTGSESFFGLYNPGLWKLIRQGRFDVVICHLNYIRCSFWISYFGARIGSAAFIFGTDASSMEPRDGRGWKRLFKPLVWRFLFRLATQVLTASSAGQKLMQSLGIPEDRISMTLDTVDNDWWSREGERANRAQVRASWHVDLSDRVVLFCAKLQPWKRPLDVLRAFAGAAIPRSVLVFAGDGTLRSTIEAEASALGVRDQVRILGFVNQSQLPGVYRASDVMVISSEFEPFGLVVNEAMLCGCVVVASDRVGAVGDLITPERTGFVYPCGDTHALAYTLRRVVGDSWQWDEIRRRARAQMERWSPQVSALALVDAVTRAAAHKGKFRQAGKAFVGGTPAAKASRPDVRAS